MITCTSTLILVAERAQLRAEAEAAVVRRARHDVRDLVAPWVPTVPGGGWRGLEQRHLEAARADDPVPLELDEGSLVSLLEHELGPRVEVFDGVLTVRCAEAGQARTAKLLRALRNTRFTRADRRRHDALVTSALDQLTLRRFTEAEQTVDELLRLHPFSLEGLKLREILDENRDLDGWDRIR